ncbi:MAG TPA: cytochrome c biogenesis protein CcsA [Prolixibacteraceae bacterium]|nr:cytochrome c biogenesis protein CcsA [Prolixibacteraceae bacterium]
MKKLISSFFSMTTTAVLLVVFAFSIAYATFLENDYGTATARILIYNSVWFEILLLLLSVNLAGSIFYHKLVSRGKWAVLLFHSAFLVILVGAAITRHYSFEGSLHIREGEQNNQLMTDGTFITIEANSGADTTEVSEEVRFSPYTRNRFSKSLEVGTHQVRVENLRFVPSATETIVEDPAGESILSMLVVDRNSSRADFLLKPGESVQHGDVGFAFMPCDDTSGVIIAGVNGELHFRYPDTVYVTSMDQSQMSALAPGISHPLSEKVIYQVGQVGFVLKKYLPKAKSELLYVPSHAGTFTRDALHARVTVNGKQKEVFLYGKKGETGAPRNVVFEGVTVSISYGSVVHTLPFTLKLDDFQIERYPGSNSPSSFASEVILIDPQNKVERPFRIFMNNILKYRGYRFFQSSFDEDEKGTILSVNYDSVGTAVTYAGYFLMILGMILTLFSRRSRFVSLARTSSRLARERKKIFTLLALAALLIPDFSAQAQNPVVSPDHAARVGTLLVQNNEGRIEPVNTLASEVLRKVAKKGSFNGLNPVQVMLEMMIEPEKWRNVPIIRVGDAELRRILMASDGYVSFSNILSEEDGNYLLRDYVSKAYGKEPAERNKFDKEIINVDERVNILFKFMNGGFLTIFPIPGDASNKWLSPADAVKPDFHGEGDFIRESFGNYLSALEAARWSGDYGKAGRFLDQLKVNQKEKGAEIYPSNLKTNLEVFYINFNIFSKLSKIYIVVGLALLVLQLVSLLTLRSWPGRWERAGFWVVAGLLAVHTLGLGIRWYISGHAPWSNGYETLLYISWATCMAGLFFARRSPMTLAVTTILSAISLFVAGMSWMSPELTNLVPVLKSYWLVIHVAVITASYGFFALAALLGMVNLLLIIIDRAGNNEKIGFTLRELVLIIEMAIIAGLFMLTAGSFLGGIWANESWGRYWGWDPKETWAMVTILVYAFIAHMHNIRGFRGIYAMSLASLAGFGSVLMTFFGVNYYLSGLHSYAGGEPVPIPAGVYVAVSLVVLLAITSFVAYKRRKTSEG